jgi:hypothetical protein
MLILNALLRCDALGCGATAGLQLPVVVDFNGRPTCQMPAPPIGWKVYSRDGGPWQASCPECIDDDPLAD